MRATLAITWTSLVRLLRDRSNIFFVFIFPLMLVLLIGLAFGGGATSVVGVVVDGSVVGESIASQLAEQDLVVERYEDADDLRGDVARGTVEAGAIVRPDGDGTVVEYLAGPDATGALLRSTVESAAAEVGNVQRAVDVVSARTDLDPAAARELVGQVRGVTPGVDVEARQAGQTAFEGFEQLGTFGFGAVGQLLLFVFLTSLTGSAALIQTRQLGVARRMLAAPVRTGAILGGQALGRFAVALVQAVYIVVGTALVFDVEWGDPLGSAAVIVLFSLVSAAAGMLLGSVVSNDSQAGGIGVLVGLGFAALGGSMLPLELFSPTMRQVAHATPHAWAQEAFADLLRRGGTIVDILPELAVLAGMAAFLLVVATWSLHRAIVRP